MDTSTPPDTSNDYLFTWDGRSFSFMRPPVNMDPDATLRAAAYMVAMAQPHATHDFATVLEAVQNA